MSGAAIRWEGQVATFDPRLESSPCYHCLYPDESIENEIVLNTLREEHIDNEPRVDNRMCKDKAMA